MAENYSLNHGFGLNVSPNGAKNKQAPSINVDIAKNVGDLLDLTTSYVAKYEDVFNGKVEHETNMYSRQAMIIGMNLNATETKRQFDMNI